MMSNLDLTLVVTGFLVVLYVVGLLLSVCVVKINCCIEILPTSRIHPLNPFGLVFG